MKIDTDSYRYEQGTSPVCPVACQVGRLESRIARTSSFAIGSTLFNSSGFPFKTDLVSWEAFISFVISLGANTLFMKFDLEERLINFSVLILDITERLPDTKGSVYLSGQLIRCGTAPALHYGEAQSAESRKDFIHKMKLALKEMRESSIWLRIIERKKYLADPSILRSLSELNELISIFVTSIETARANLKSMETS